jgi:diguanylate cyclase (GGDEF)-like protein
MVPLAEEARPWVISVDDEVADPAEVDLLRRLGKDSALGVPIRAGGLVWGELFVTRTAGQPRFAAADIPFAQAFAGLLSAGLAQVGHRERVERLAVTDPLTGLGNRRMVETAVSEALAAGIGVAVVMADLNRLKAANDTHGHAAGDAAIRAIAGAMSAAVGRHPGAVVGRMGGDEFCAVLPGCDAAGALAVGQEVADRSVDAPYGVSAALGIAVAGPGEVTDLSALLAAADAAQYEAKVTGADGPVLGAPGDALGDRRRWRSRWDTADLLRTGLERAAGAGDVVARLADAIGALAAECDALGWVLSGRQDGTALPVAGAAWDDDVRLTAVVPAPEGAEWLAEAALRGVVVVDDPPLAATRGAAQVAVAVAAGWIGEILLPESAPAGQVAVVLRAVMAAAVANAMERPGVPR